MTLFYFNCSFLQNILFLIFHFIRYLNKIILYIYIFLFTYKNYGGPKPGPLKSPKPIKTQIHRGCKSPTQTCCHRQNQTQVVLSKPTTEIQQHLTPTIKYNPNPNSYQNPSLNKQIHVPKQVDQNP